MPILSSNKDQKPIFPVPYMNSPGSLYRVRYLRRTMVAHEALELGQQKSQYMEAAETHKEASASITATETLTLDFCDLS
jgi:hypothetical protein